MPKQIPNQYTSYELTEKEHMSGQLLSEANLYVFRNLLSQYSSEKLMLDYTPNDPVGYAQREAELKGQILLIQQILSDHEVAVQFFSSDSNQSLGE